MDIRELGLMTFSQASERWKKEKSYVFQQYTKYPNKFMPGSVDFLKSANSNRGTFVITREGMEHLTGQTEEEANSSEWVVYVEQNFNIIDEKFCDSEEAAEDLIIELVQERLPGKSRIINLGYLDDQKNCFGVLLADGVKIYRKKRIGVRK